jgi:hypothetical protein
VDMGKLEKCHRVRTNHISVTCDGSVSLSLSLSLTHQPCRYSDVMPSLFKVFIASVNEAWNVVMLRRCWKIIFSYSNRLLSMDAFNGSAGFSASTLFTAFLKIMESDHGSLSTCGKPCLFCFKKIYQRVSSIVYCSGDCERLAMFN